MMRIYIRTLEERVVEQEKFDDCMLRICNGDKDALKEIYEAYVTYVYSVILRVVNNQSDAEDITGDFFLKLWTNSEKYSPGHGHKAFLATMARNMAIDFLRKHNREVPIGDFSSEQSDGENGNTSGFDKPRVLDESGQEYSLADQGFGSSVENEVIEDISLKEALSKLKPREQEVINLKIMGDMTFKEITEVMGIPMGTVTWLYRQAIEKLRRCGYE